MVRNVCDDVLDFLCFRGSILSFFLPFAKVLAKIQPIAGFCCCWLSVDRAVQVGAEVHTRARQPEHEHMVTDYEPYHHSKWARHAKAIDPRNGFGIHFLFPVLPSFPTTLDNAASSSNKVLDHSQHITRFLKERFYC